MSRLLPPAEVEYPSSNGKPIAETGIHVQAILLLFQALEDALARAGKPDAFIAADMYWYWQQGDPKKRLAPDLMVVPGAGRHHRRSFKSWAEGGRVPAAVIEVSSDKTAEYDRGKKLRRYQRLRVAECFLFDPEGLYLPAPLMGYRLTGGKYVRLTAAAGRLTSDLGFGLAAEGQMLRLFDGSTGQPIPTLNEAVAAARAALAEGERAAAEAVWVAAAEIARLRALLDERGP